MKNNNIYEISNNIYLVGEKNRIGSGPSPVQRSNSLMGNEFSHGNNQSLESNMQPFSDSPSMPFGPNSQQSIQQQQQQQQQQQNVVSGPGNPNKMGPEVRNEIFDKKPEICV